MAQNKMTRQEYNKNLVSNTLIPSNYLYISHLDEEDQFWILPNTPDSISDSMLSSFSPTTALGRTAPVYTYSGSGPRTVQIDLKLHRDMLDEANAGISNVKPEAGKTYMDELLRALQAIALPKYNLSNKAIEPPLLALRIENQIFVKGVLSGSIGLTYSGPLQSDGKFAVVGLSLIINEVDPYDSTSVYKNGGFRGCVNTLRKGMGLEEN